ncbi:MAG: hypothetical protein JEZ05_02245 [Tenericutes bacterium]|nr:hypothetical protein [Mycoplasmatota bacterium]
MEKTIKRETIIIYSIGFIVFYLGMFFKNTTLVFGDFLYWSTRNITPLVEYVLIALGLIIILYEFISTKTYEKVYKKVFIDKKVSLFEITALVSCLVFFIFPYIPGTVLYIVLNMLLILLMVYITIKVDVLYIFSIILLLLQFSEKMIWYFFGTSPNLLIVKILLLAAYSLVLVDVIIKVIRKKEFLSNFTFLLINVFVYLWINFVENLLIFSSGGFRLAEYYYIWIFPICISPLIIIYFSKKTKKIKLFKWN